MEFDSENLEIKSTRSNKVEAARLIPEKASNSQDQRKMTAAYVDVAN